MKGLLIFPPQWYPGNPYPAVPLLLGQLKRAGFNTKGLDINLDFYNRVLTKDYMEKSVKKIYDIKNQNTKAAEVEIRSNGKLAIINKYLTNHPGKLTVIPQEIEQATKTLKNADLFYNPELLFKAKEIIFDALRIASLPFAPAELSFANYYNPAAMAGYEELKAGCYDRSTNIFIEHYESIIDSIIDEKAGYAVISATDMTQLIPAFTLARMLKERCDIPLCIGGNIITKLLSNFKLHPEIFDLFCDYLSYGDGENSIISFASIYHNNKSRQDVKGLVYRNDSGDICDTGAPTDTDLNDVADASFDGYKLNEYFSPEPVFSIKLSKGCYWGKCAFCDVSYGRKHFSIKSPEKAVDEFRRLKERYNIHNFTFGDDSVSPEYYSKLSKLLIENDLNINIFSWTRLESGFTQEVLNEMFRAGCKMTFWGYESASERVMKKINKGINYNTRLDFLKIAEDAGIWNHVAFMFGFPTETEAEAQETVSVINEHKDVVNSCYLSRFSFKKNAAIAECPERYEIVSYNQKSEFSLDNEYCSTGMTEVEKRNFISKFKSDYLHENIDRLWPMLCVDFEHLLLYLSRYGRDWVRDYRLKTIPESVTGFLASL